MLDVYLTRHGTTIWNTQERMQGRDNSPLTQEGIQDAHTLKTRLLPFDFTGCFTSPMPRAVHTSLILIGDRSVPLFFEDTLSEMALSDWEGVRVEDAKRSDPERFYNFRNRPELYVPSANGEDFRQVVCRAQAFLDKLALLPPDMTPILGVTHCILLQAIVMLCDNRPLSTLRSGQEVRQTTLFHIRLSDEGIWSVIERNS